MPFKNLSWFHNDKKHKNTRGHFLENDICYDVTICLIFLCYVLIVDASHYYYYLHFIFMHMNFKTCMLSMEIFIRLEHLIFHIYKFHLALHNLVHLLDVMLMNVNFFQNVSHMQFIYYGRLFVCHAQHPL
jgi:hypothetical protein